MVQDEALERLAAFTKEHTSTVALVPPETAWSPIQATRESLQDKGIYRWPPHINLLYPFLPPPALAEAVSLLAPALEAIEEFDVTLDALGIFGGRARGVLYCHASSPVETERLCELQAALQGALPFCSEQRRQGVFSTARLNPNLD